MVDNIETILNNDLSQASIKLNFFEGITVLFLALIVGLYIRYLYNKFAITYSSRISFGNTLLIITISVAALISVVKASLALSLGLVGALSVIRFRTAVKEPFNLSIMLFAICTAIAIGASQFIFALQILIFGTFAMIFSFRANRSSSRGSSSTKTEEIDTVSLELAPDTKLQNIYTLLSEKTIYYSIISLDQNNNENLMIVVNVKIADQIALASLKDEIFKNYPNSRFSFYNTPAI